MAVFVSCGGFNQIIFKGLANIGFTFSHHFISVNHQQGFRIVFTDVLK
ncbi:Uncharacterised protein [Vibrio cholerae]|uniref:Uncharacterized protein n=1 Tax=Vibrio cholerae TaxID=666 RepID=A0A655RMC0_VIBCL|nr:Uncharacterised protein [Vibrio cholerae]CSB06065.1 Uncharacterised protein [Vibrio cholerae]